MKSIEYDPHDYEIINTIEYDNGDLFQKIQFKTGYYGILYTTTEKNKKYTDIIFISTDKNSDIYINVFLEFARSQTEVINKIHEKVDKVHLVIQLNKEQSQIFEQMITKDQANDLLERLRITNEIIELREANNYNSFPTLSIILVICIFINLACAIYNLKGGF